MKPVHNSRSSRLKRLVMALAVCGAGACGVVEHPHDLQAIDTSNDFGPLPSGGSGAVVPGGGSAALPTSGASQGGGSPPVGGSGSLAGGGAAPVAGTSSGGSVGASGGSSASGVTINLGGVEVPKEKAIAFIHLGHSNMAGRAAKPQESRAYHFTETNPHAYTYHAGSPPELALEPKTAGDSGNTMFPGSTQAPAGGPGTALVKEAATLAPDYYFISLGYGKASAYCSQFVPGGLYYDQLIAAPKAIKGRVTFGGIFIYLGITERHGTAADINGFANCINTLVTAIRNDVGEPALPALMNDYEVEGSGEFVVGGAVATAIQPQIEACPSVVSNFALVSAQGITMQDDHHFDLDGHRTWVQRALMTMQQKGWFPWAP